MAESFEWHPTRLLRSHDESPNFALLVLNQPLRNKTSLRWLWQNASIRVAADGGANRLHQLSSFQAKFSNLQAIIGDLDSLGANVREFYTAQATPAEVIHDPDQYSTDFGKAVNWIRKTQPQGLDIVALGGIGGRVDQGISQLHQLYLFQSGSSYTDGHIYLLSEASLTFLLKAGSHKIYVRDGDDEEGGGAPTASSGAPGSEAELFGKHVGILPLKEPSRITTKGLEWDVTDWETCIGGQLSTSNHILPETRCVEIETTADVLFTVAMKDDEER